MNEIKFRVWDEIRKMWHIFTLDDIVYEQAIGVYEISSINADFNKAYQFTGLKDKNGKEIYVGDILRTWCGGDEQNSPYLVEDLRSFYEAIDTKDSYLRINQYERIGNIHENPELIKKSKIN